MLVFVPAFAIRQLARRAGFVEAWSGLRSTFDTNGIDVVVDSSKTCLPTAGRPLCLRSAGYDVEPVFLWRNPAAAVSRQQRALGRAKGDATARSDPSRLYPRTLASWLLANALGLVVMRRLGGSLYLRYEDVAASPASLDLGRLELEHQSKKGIESVHMCSGNRMVHQPMSVESTSEDATRGPKDHGVYVLVQRFVAWVVASERTRARKRYG